MGSGAGIGANRQAANACQRGVVARKGGPLPAGRCQQPGLACDSGPGCRAAATAPSTSTGYNQLAPGWGYGHVAASLQYATGQVTLNGDKMPLDEFVGMFGMPALDVPDQAAPDAPAEPVAPQQ